MQINKEENKILAEVLVIEFLHELDLVDKLIFIHLYQGKSIRQAAERLGFDRAYCSRRLSGIRKKAVRFFELPEALIK